MNPQFLQDWLDWLETLNPREIELGLGRVRQVQESLNLYTFPCPVITVAGTNGKGSTIALLESMLRAAGYRTGTYTSPHLIRFNERVRIDGVPVDDGSLIEAFIGVEQAREDVPLTYFEFTTLAALKLFDERQPDVLILEVGLGGRLDAVNCVDADVAVITAIDLDHQDWLGDTREAIAREKAGIMRPGRPAVCADPQPPASLLAHAETVGARLLCAGREYQIARTDEGWDWRGPETGFTGLPFPALPGYCQLDNAAAALAAWACLHERLPIDEQAIRKGLQSAELPGRLQHKAGSPAIWLDVAHNPQAIGVLVAELRKHAEDGRLLAVVGMLRDKDLPACLAPMLPLVDQWFTASLAGTRAASARELIDCLTGLEADVRVSQYDNPVAAFAAARQQAGPQDSLVVFGSFQTVGAIMAQLQTE